LAVVGKKLRVYLVVVKVCPSVGDAKWQHALDGIAFTELSDRHRPDTLFLDAHQL